MSKTTAILLFSLDPSAITQPLFGKSNCSSSTYPTSFITKNQMKESLSKFNYSLITFICACVDTNYIVVQFAVFVRGCM